MVSGFSKVPPVPPRAQRFDALTARKWHLLYLALQLVGDGIRDDINEIGSDVIVGDVAPLAVLGELPSITFAMDRVWRTRLADAADDLRRDMDSGVVPYPRCPGEEAVLYLAFDRAVFIAESGLCDELLESVPAEIGDSDWGEVTEYLFEDGDYAMVFGDPLFDGAEDPTSDVSIGAGIADYRAKSWFLEFSGMIPREKHVN